MATWTKVVTESSSGEIGQNAASATIAAAITSAGTLTFTGDVTGGTTPTYTSGGNLSIAMANAVNSVDGTHIALGSDTSGDVMYYDGSNYVRLAKGSDGQVLKLASGTPSWAADTNTGEVNQSAYSNFTVPTGTTAQAADEATDTMTFTAAGGMTITGGADDTIEFSSANTQLDNAGVIGKVLTGMVTSSTADVAASDTIVVGMGKLEARVALNDDKVTNTDVSVSKDNLESTLALMDTNYTIGSTASIDGTISGSLTVTGDLTVSGTNTIVNTTELKVEDKLITLANVEDSLPPTKSTADAAGIQIESNAVQEVDWPTLKWNKDKGGGHTTGTGTANGLTGWSVSNMQTSAHVSLPIAVMEFSTNSTAPTGIAGGVGSFHFDSGDDELYIRTV